MRRRVKPQSEDGPWGWFSEADLRALERASATEDDYSWPQDQLPITTDGDREIARAESFSLSAEED